MFAKTVEYQTRQSNSQRDKQTHEKTDRQTGKQNKIDDTGSQIKYQQTHPLSVKC